MRLEDEGQPSAEVDAGKLRKYFVADDPMIRCHEFGESFGEKLNISISHASTVLGTVD